MLYATLGISIIFLCTSLGSASVFFFRKPITERVNQILLGFSSGIMLSASIFSLIMPALEDDSSSLPSWLVVSLSLLLGALFLWGIDKLVPHLHANNKEEGIKSKKLSRNGKMFLAVTIHNVPEGLSVGIAFGGALASMTSNDSTMLISALLLAIGIGIQNVPEGAVVSLPIKAETQNSLKAFLFGVFSGAVEPVAAIIGLFLAMQLSLLMPYALSFAAGCMLYVIAEEMIPDMKGDSLHHYGVWSFFLGFVLMLSLDVALG